MRANNTAPSEPATMMSATMGIGKSMMVCVAAVKADAKSETITAKACRRISVNPTFSEFSSSEGHYFSFGVCTAIIFSENE
jgi:hypothetical protein